MSPNVSIRSSTPWRLESAQAPRTAGREKTLPIPAEKGYLYCGQTGAGHFVKMIHNGIEYGVMAAYAEGLNVLRHANAGMVPHDVDAETAPLRNPEYYEYDMNLTDIVEVWRRGSVIAGWLMDLTAAALFKNANLDDFTGRVSDSGEGRWTIAAAIDEAVPVPVLSTALYERFSSAAQPILPTSCCPPCGSNLAATSKSTPPRHPSRGD